VLLSLYAGWSTKWWLIGIPDGSRSQYVKRISPYWHTDTQQTNIFVLQAPEIYKDCIFWMLPLTRCYKPPLWEISGRTSRLGEWLSLAVYGRGNKFRNIKFMKLAKKLTKFLLYFLKFSCFLQYSLSPFLCMSSLYPYIDIFVGLLSVFSLFVCTVLQYVFISVCLSVRSFICLRIC
jgi:hypothetical protein